MKVIYVLGNFFIFPKPVRRNYYYFYSQEEENLDTEKLSGWTKFIP